jgi:hypothetical protein
MTHLSGMRVKQNHFLFLFLTVIAIILGCHFTFQTVNAQTASKINSIQTIIKDMQGLHEAMPHGVPKHYNWATAPNIGMGNNPKNFQAAIAWGQVYESAEGNPAKNSRVQIRNIKAYILSKKDNKWRLLQNSTGVDGAAYHEDFAGDANKPANVRNESDGTISVKAGDGYNFHFWTKTGRATINPNDIAGIFTTAQARLVTDDTKNPDDRFKARYLLNVGGDYWQDLTAKWDNFKTNGGIGMGKFKFVTTEWQAFNMITRSPDEISKNPPPID